MRALEVAVALLRGVAITLIAAWLFVLAWLFSAHLLDSEASAGSLFLSAVLMAGTAVYLFAPALIPLGCVLGYLTPVLAGSSLPRSTATLAGSALGLVGGACSAWLGMVFFGREVLPSAMSSHPIWVALSAGIFAASLVAVYVLLHASARERQS